MSMIRESETVELKETFVDGIKKEILAFANCDGGKIYIGIRDDGTVVGLSDADGIALQISNMVRDSIKPDLAMFVHYETKSMEGKYVLVVDVQRGTDRPYYVAKKGLRPEGVFVRQGYSSVPATDAAIRRMIKDTDGDRYEQMRALEQGLTFIAAEREFSMRNVAFGLPQQKTLGLINRDGIYTNLGLLLSDQCPHTVKAAVFQGIGTSIFKDRKEFGGSLLQQMNEIYGYIDFYNRTKSTFQGLLRVDTRDYPEAAVREALLNMLVHRDYGFSASSLIKIYDDRMEFISVGGLATDVELDDILMGLSFCRNANLANIFYRLELIEAYGTGMGKIMGAYNDVEVKPIVETTRNAFKITLPNKNYNANKYPKNGEKTIVTYNYMEPEAQVKEYVDNYGTVNRSEVEHLLETSGSTATRVLRRLVEQGVLVKEGRGKNVRYVAVKK